MINFPESFTRQEAWLLQTAIVMGYAIEPVETYYKHDDWFLDADIMDCFHDGERIILSCEEIKELRSKPALTQSMFYGDHDSVTRLTKAGWQRAKELAWRLLVETDSYMEYSADEWRFWLVLDNIA